MVNLAKLLKTVKFFEGISDTARDSLAEICRIKECAKKEYLFHEGEEGDSVFLLINGNIQLHKTSPEGKEIVIKVIQAGEIFAEVILFEQNRYPVTAIALSSSQVLVIPKTDLSGLLDKTEFRNDFIAMLMKKQRYLSSRVHYLSAYDLEERFRLFLEEQYGKQKEVLCTLSKKDIAAAIGATPESLSRLIVRLREQGKISWQRQTIELDDSFWD